MEILSIREPSNEDIIEAISIRTSECFGAMNMCNALGGVETNSWYIVRRYSLLDIKKEALERGLAFSGRYDSLNGEIWETPY